MGHLFSRALKRITQGSQPRAQQLHNQSSEQQDTNETTSDSGQVESIPVGQSIDSAEYAELRGARTAAPTVEPKPSVEEAAIKIQALVRGHLTRKALKGAQSQSVPPPHNALGQRQFDEECLLNNTSNPIFLNLYPASSTDKLPPKDSTGRDNRLPGGQGIKGPAGTSASTTLGSILEHTEAGTQQLAEPEQETDDTATGSGSGIGERRKLPKLCTSLRASTSPSRLEAAQSDSRDHSLSPVPSEANASIDLDCDTPASVSIDIADHNIRPADKLASVLHHKTTSEKEKEEPPAGPDGLSDAANKQEQFRDSSSKEDPLNCVNLANDTNTANIDASCDSNNNSNNNEEEEAAAIRIQSAFRGYRTRKNSPYRTRSPSNSLNKSHEQTLNNSSSPSRENRLALGASCDPQEQAEGSFDNADISQPVPNLSERRSSRPRVRDCDKTLGQQESDSLERAATSDGPFGEAERGVSLQSQQDLCLSDAPNRSTENPVKDSERIETFDGANNEFEFANELTEANVSELETETVAAIVGVTTNECLGAESGLVAGDSCTGRGVKSEASVETIGSSIAGALLSMDDEISASSQAMQLKDALDEDKSLGASLTIDEFDLEASRLETSAALLDHGGALVEESATTDDPQLDQSASDTATPGDDINADGDKESEGAPALDEHEQLTIELESDDIERRDPRGQATTERAKSPQMRKEAPKFEPMDGKDDSVVTTIAEATVTQIEATPDMKPSAKPEKLEALEAVDSSNSSGDDEDDDAAEQPNDTKESQQINEQRQQQQSPTSGTTSRNKKRHRNKRRAAKK